MRLFAAQRETINVGRGVLFMLGGVVMGTAVGLLAAPQSGTRTRRHLVRGAEEAKVQVADLCDDVTTKVADLGRGVAGTVAVAKNYLDKRSRELLGNPPRRQNPIRRLIHRLRG